MPDNIPGNDNTIMAIIQARMTSSRYPGKMLAPLRGKPVLAHVLARIRAGVSHMPVVLATSDDASDDPLALYGQHLGIAVVRGPREDVLGRFAIALRVHPCTAFFRVCGDSPLLSPDLFKKAVAVYRQQEEQEQQVDQEKQEERFDLVTNVFPRTFPVGMSVELVRSDTFLSLEKTITDPADREHVTRYYYQHPEKFHIRNIECANPADPTLRLAVDELQDLKNIARYLESGIPWQCSRII